MLDERKASILRAVVEEYIQAVEAAQIGPGPSAQDFSDHRHDGQDGEDQQALPAQLAQIRREADVDEENGDEDPIGQHGDTVFDPLFQRAAPEHQPGQEGPGDGGHAPHHLRRPAVEQEDDKGEGDQALADGQPGDPAGEPREQPPAESDGGRQVEAHP